MSQRNGHFHFKVRLFEFSPLTAFSRIAQQRLKSDEVLVKLGFKIGPFLRRGREVEFKARTQRSENFGKVISIAK